MTQQQIPVHFIYGNIEYEVSYTLSGTMADVMARPLEVTGTGVPYSFDISHGSFIYHDLLTNDKNNTVFVSALTGFLNNNVSLP